MDVFPDHLDHDNFWNTQAAGGAFAVLLYFAIAEVEQEEKQELVIHAAFMIIYDEIAGKHPHFSD